MYETTVTVVGNIASDVSSRRVGDDGQLVVSFRVASTARRRDKATGEWVDGDRFAARVSCWRSLGEGVLTSLAKGDPVVISGRVSVREYEVEGERRYITEIAADTVGPDLARSSAHVRRRRAVSAEEASGGDALTGSGGPSTVGVGTAYPGDGSADRTNDDADVDGQELSTTLASSVDEPGGKGRKRGPVGVADEHAGVLAATG